LLAILSSTIAFAWCDSTCRIFVVVAIRDGIDAGYGCGDNDGTGWLIAHGVEVVVLGIVMFRLRHFRDDFGTSCPATPPRLQKLTLFCDGQVLPRNCFWRVSFG